MEIIITGFEFSTGSAIRRHMEEKLQAVSNKLKKGKVHKIHAVLNKDGINFLCRIDVIKEFGGKPVIHASSEATEAYPCVDAAIKKIEEQIIKHKQKSLTERKLADVSTASEVADEVYDMIDETVDEELIN